MSDEISDLTRDAWAIALRQIEVEIETLRHMSKGTDSASIEYRAALIAAWSFARDALAAKVAEMDAEEQA